MITKIEKSSKRGSKPGERRGGRKKGTPNKRTAARDAHLQAVEARMAEVIPGLFEGDSHALLMSVYKDPAQEWSARIDAAKAAIRFEKPALAAVETGKPGDFKKFKTKEELRQSIKERSIRLGISKNVVPIDEARHKQPCTR